MSAQDYIPSRPEWLDDEFVKTCIKNDVGASSIDDIDIRDIDIQYAVPKGENYTSVILRLLVKGVSVNWHKQSNGNLVNGSTKDQNANVINGSTKYQNGSVKGPTDEKRYILKVMVTDANMTILLDDMKAFAREVDMYQTFVPKLHKILSQVNLDTTFSCRCLQVLDDKSVIVMEDLGVEKYILADRKKGADIEHTKLLLHKLGRLHGASMKYYEQTKYEGVPGFYFEGMIKHVEDENIRKILEPIFGHTMITQKVKELAEDIRKRPGYENEANLLENLAVHSHGLLCDMYKFKPGNIFNAHLHGDCWINNMLYKYNDEGKPIDVMLLDLQLAYVNSVGNEFMYYFLTSVSDDVREHHFDDMVKYYYDSFTETLEKVEYNGIIPTLEQLHEELISCSAIFIMVISFMLCVMKAELDNETKDRNKAEAVSMEGLLQLAQDNRNNPSYLNTLFITLDLLKEIGVLEHHENILKKLTAK